MSVNPLGPPPGERATGGAPEFADCGAARLPVFDRRRTGILLHLSSLDTPLGRGGRAFIDWLADAGFTVWQILPIGPTGPDRSPYFARSDFAGNPEFLDLAAQPEADPLGYADYLNAVRHWIDDYALFEVVGSLRGGTGWWSWPVELRDRHPAALCRLTRDFSAQLDHVKRRQFAFFAQWQKLREYAHSRGVRLFGDLPFYLGPNSAETWARREQFQLDTEGRAHWVSGLPPDCLCPAGQVWHHPLYDWEHMRSERFVHWRARVSEQLQRVDLLRLDHFQALASHWAVPAHESQARNGQWRPTPGRELLRLLKQDMNALPVAAEDLGIFSQEANLLRRQFGVPGMRVLQFAFDGFEDNVHLPHGHRPDSIIYTGTHDNDTTLGWYSSLDGETRARLRRVLHPASSMPAALIDMALSSIGKLAVIPMQDVLGLGSEARLNTPGTVSGNNWSWKSPECALTPARAKHWYRINRLHGRI